MSRIINEKYLPKLKRFRSVLLKVSAWTFVGCALLCVILILGGADTMQFQIFGKMLGSLFVIAFMMLISVNNFKMMESENKAAGGFAILGLICNLLWSLLWILIIWEVLYVWPYQDPAYKSSMYDGYRDVMTFSGKIASISSILSMLGLAVSNILNIKEYDKVSTIKPIKITSVSCWIYVACYFIIMILSDFSIVDYRSGSYRFLLLSIFAWFVGLVSMIIAYILSKNTGKQIAEEKNNNKDNMQGTGDIDEDKMRAEIEKRVREEMIEKEVRAKIEAEMREKSEEIKEENVLPQDNGELGNEEKTNF